MRPLGIRQMSTPADRVSLGIVGLGFMGQVHATNAETFGHEVVAGADLDAETRTEFAEDYDAHTYNDAETMYENEALDAIAVSTPNSVHEEAVVPALDRGLDVLCEKPIANDLDSAERIAETAVESDGFCAINFHNRVSTAAIVFDDYREEGYFGEITHVDANYVRRRGIPGVGSWFTSETLAGGGAVVDIGVHAIDFALFLMGYPAVESVSATTRTDFGDRETYVDPGDWYDETDEAVFDVEDSATATIRCVDDRTIALDVAWAANQPETKAFTARGTEAGATLTIGGEELTLYQSGKQGTDHSLDATLTDGSIDHTGWEGSDKRFLDAVAGDTDPALGTVEQALTVQRVIDAIYRSADERRAVSIE